MTDDLRSVPLARLELMDAAGRELAAAERALERQGFNVVGRLLRDEGTFYEWDHYPAGDVYDPHHGAQYFYHAHAAAQRAAEEHGHFHTFIRPGAKDRLHHLVAIAVDHRSQPIRLFTVNRWVTEDDWLAALVRMFRPEIEALLHQRDAAIAAWQSRHAGEDPLAARDIEIMSERAISVAAQVDAVARALAGGPRRRR